MTVRMHGLALPMDVCSLLHTVYTVYSVESMYSVVEATLGTWRWQHAYVPSPGPGQMIVTCSSNKADAGAEKSSDCRAIVMQSHRQHLDGLQHRTNERLYSKRIASHGS